LSARLDPIVAAVTARIAERSSGSRAAYLSRVAHARESAPRRTRLPCGNLAHGFAACGAHDKAALAAGALPNLAIVTAYNDMLSAHAPYARYPELIREAARAAGATAQVAGGVPAMCDGITQGRAGMELSLFSRDVIAMSTAIALSHDMFDGALFLGVCDKIVPGLLIGALAFGHLPAVFVPAGPMPAGLANEDKSRVRQRHAEGLASREELLAAEAASYHSPGTCTFYGTANSNQMLMEIMGLQLPGASFVNPDHELRDPLTAAATQRAAALARTREPGTAVGELIDERAIVNGVVGLHATGGSTNHLLHLVAVARAAGIDLRWEDFAELATVVPLLARIYPNGFADVNQFQRAGGMAVLIGELLDAGLLHAQARTVAGGTLAVYRNVPRLESGRLGWHAAAAHRSDDSVLRPVHAPFQADGGLRLLTGNLGRAVIKVSALARESRCIRAPALVFETQEQVAAAFARGELSRDFVAVVRFQGPRANGMPELHKLSTLLGVLQDRGHRVALLTDGRMSGASGKVPAAIHVTPEAAAAGAIARVRGGDLICIDAQSGTVDVLVDAQEWGLRSPAQRESLPGNGMGRELFDLFRRTVGAADEGASIFGVATQQESFPIATAERAQA